MSKPRVRVRGASESMTRSEKDMAVSEMAVFFLKMARLFFLKWSPTGAHHRTPIHLQTVTPSK